MNFKREHENKWKNKNEHYIVHYIRVKVHNTNIVDGNVGYLFSYLCRYTRHYLITKTKIDAW